MLTLLSLVLTSLLAQQASPLQVSVECPKGVVIAGLKSPMKLTFTNTGKERVKLDPALLTGLGLRIRPMPAPETPVPPSLLDTSALGKETPVEIPPGASLSVEVDASSLGALLAGKFDAAEFWFEVPGFKSAPVSAELVEDLSKSLVVLETNKGTIKIKLDTVNAPLASRNFARLAAKGSYDATLFHRVLKGFMAQGGDFATKPGGSGERKDATFNGKVLHAEISDTKHVRGTLSMARVGDPIYANPQAKMQLAALTIQLEGKTPDQANVTARAEEMNKAGVFRDRQPFLDSGGSQFFLCFKEAPMLDGAYTAFGKVVDGDDVLTKLEAVGAESDQDGGGKPKEELKILKARVEPAK